MAVDRKIFTEDVDVGLKANKEFTKFYLNCKIDGKTKQKIFDYSNKNWDKATRRNKAKKDALDFKESIITPPPNNLKNQQAYLTLGC